MNVDNMNLIFVDVEAVGHSPINGTMTEFGAVHYHSRKTYYGLLHESVIDPENPARRVLRTDTPSYPGEPIMQAFRTWLNGFDGRPVFVSDNNGYDAMWITCEFDRWRIDNPFGHSSRRISDFYAGLVGNFRKTQSWKKWRVTPHTHHPVDDAMGNVEAFAEILRRFGDRFDGIAP